MEKELLQNKDHLIRVVLFGPESTGKTTMSKALAHHYKTVWVAEYAREFLQKKWDETKEICSEEDILPIAYGQMKIENEGAKKANQILICDTNLLETQLYAEAYFDGYNLPQLAAAAAANYNIYFLTDIDVPFEADDLRDRPDQRQEMFNCFKNGLVSRNIDYHLLSGTHEIRLKKAISIIDTFLKN